MQASMIAKFKYASLANDNQAIVVVIEQPDGTERAVQFPKEQLVPLIELCAGVARALDNVGGPSSVYAPLKATGFSVYDLGHTGLTAIGVRLAEGTSGPRFTFAAQKQLARQLRELLQANLGETPLPDVGHMH